MQKKPFYVFVSLLVLSACLLMACSTTITPVYLLRHAEKQLGINPDKGVTPPGFAAFHTLQEKRVLPIGKPLQHRHRRLRIRQAKLAVDVGNEIRERTGCKDLEDAFVAAIQLVGAEE